MNELKTRYKGSGWLSELFKIFADGLRQGNFLSRAFLFAQNQELGEEEKLEKTKRVQREQFSNLLSNLWGEEEDVTQVGGEQLGLGEAIDDADDTPQMREYKYLEQYKYKNEKLSAGRSFDGSEVKLDTVEICPKSLVGKKPEDQKYTIYFKGQAEFYENNFERLEKDAKDFQHVSIGFNYRGAGESTGIARSMDDLVADGIAQVQRLLDKGVKPENITLSGWSLGGGVATLVAKHFHDKFRDEGKNQNINLFADRTFSSLTNAVLGFIRTIGSGGEFGQNSGKQESWFGKALAFILKPLVKAMLRAEGWDHDIAAAYQALPTENKRAVNASGDAIVSDYAALRAGLDNPEEHRASMIYSPSAVLGDIESHSAPLNELISLQGDFHLASFEFDSASTTKNKLAGKFKSELDQDYQQNPDKYKLPVLIQWAEGVVAYWREPTTGETKLQFLSKNLYEQLPFPDLSGAPVKVTLSNEQKKDIAENIPPILDVLPRTAFSAEETYQTFMSPPKVASVTSPAITNQQKNELNQLSQEIDHLTSSFQQAVKDSQVFPVEAKQNMEQKLQQLCDSLQTKTAELNGSTKTVDKEEIDKISNIVKQTENFITNIVQPLASSGAEQKLVENLAENIEETKTRCDLAKSAPLSEQKVLTDSLIFAGVVGEATLNTIEKAPSFRGYPVSRPVENIANVLRKSVSESPQAVANVNMEESRHSLGGGR